MAKEEKTAADLKHEALTAEISANAKAIKERKEKEIKAGFLNPIGEGTTYAEFLEQLGKKTVAEYCKGKLDDATIEWIEKELEQLN